MITLRQTILNDFETCGELCRLNWGESGSFGRCDEQEFTNKYAVVGIALHEVMEVWGLEKMKGNKVPLEELHNLIDEKVDDFDLELFDDEEEVEKYRTSLHEQLDWLWIEALCDFVTPIGVEVTFNLENLIETCLPFVGTIDRITGDLSKREVILEDYKSGKTYTKKELSSNMQATIYSLAFYKMFGFLPTQFVFYFSKTKKKKIIQITPEFLKAGTERILSNWLNIREGNFDTNGNKFFCNNFCSAKEECPRYYKRNNAWDDIA